MLLLIGFIGDICSFYLEYRGQPNFNIFNWFLLIETIFLYYFFFNVLSSRLAGIIISIFTLGFLVIWLRLFIKVGAKAYLDIGVTFENISIIILSILYFYEQVNKPDSHLFYNQPDFWVVAAYLVYSAGTFFLFLYIDVLQRHDQPKYYVLHDIFKVLKSILLCIAMFMQKDQHIRNKFQIT